MDTTFHRMYFVFKFNLLVTPSSALFFLDLPLSILIRTHVFVDDMCAQNV